jgi:hypothetical protein
MIIGRRMIKVKWPKIININSVDVPKIEWINMCNGTIFQICMFSTTCRPCILYPRDGLFIGLNSLGCFFFDIHSALSWDYVKEKLYLPQSDARPLSDFINVQLDKVLEDEPQQGEYNINHMKGSDGHEEYYRLIGQNEQKIIEPEIISET